MSEPAVGKWVRLLGALLVLVALVVNAVVMGPATAVLGLGLVASFALWATSRWRRDRAAVLKLYLAGLGAQLLHLVEEYSGGFQRQFPGLLGYEWSDEKFLAFNVVWLVIFAAAAAGVARDAALAYLVVIFFALVGGVVNGLGHLGLCLAQGRYFPGSLTAPLSLVVGIALLRRLFGEGGPPAAAGT